MTTSCVGPNILYDRKKWTNRAIAYISSSGRLWHQSVPQRKMLVVACETCVLSRAFTKKAPAGWMHMATFLVGRAHLIRVVLEVRQYSEYCANSWVILKGFSNYMIVNCMHWPRIKTKQGLLKKGGFTNSSFMLVVTGPWIQPLPFMKYLHVVL